MRKLWSVTVGRGRAVGGRRSAVGRSRGSSRSLAGGGRSLGYGGYWLRRGGGRVGGPPWLGSVVSSVTGPRGCLLGGARAGPGGQAPPWRYCVGGDAARFAVTGRRSTRSSSVVNRPGKSGDPASAGWAGGAGD